MNLKLADGRPLSDGIDYPFEGEGVVGTVHVALSNDGMSWRVWFSLRGGATHGQHGPNPVVAFRKAVEFSLSQCPEWREWLDGASIEAQLNAQRALDPNRSVLISASALQSMGLALHFPEAIEPTLLERTLRTAAYLRRTEGLRSESWRVVSSTWKDSGHSVEVAIHRGA